MTSGGDGISGSGQGGRLMAFVLAAMLLWPAAVSAQMFTDRPPPMPPAAIPDASSGPAMNLAPPSGPASIPTPRPTLTQPSIAVVPPVVAPPATTPGQAVLSLTARYGKDLPVINNGLVWRGFAAKPHESGPLKPIAADRRAATHP